MLRKKVSPGGVSVVFSENRISLSLQSSFIRFVRVLNLLSCLVAILRQGLKLCNPPWPGTHITLPASTS